MSSDPSLKYRTLCAVVVAIFIGAFASSCDPDGKKQCAWFLRPDSQRPPDQIREGFVPVCAANLKTNKQDCRLQATLDLAKKSEKRQFRYVDMKVKGPGIPRTIESIEYCD